MAVMQISMIGNQVKYIPLGYYEICQKFKEKCCKSEINNSEVSTFSIKLGIH